MGKWLMTDEEKMLVAIDALNAARLITATALAVINECTITPKSKILRDGITKIEDAVQRTLIGFFDV